MHTFTAGPDGWTRWVFPKVEGYRMVCCDCGLAHDLQFRALRVLEESEDGRRAQVESLDPAEYQVEFRVRRNNRSTAQVRRHREQ